MTLTNLAFRFHTSEDRKQQKLEKLEGYGLQSVRLFSFEVVLDASRAGDAVGDVGVSASEPLVNGVQVADFLCLAGVLEDLTSGPAREENSLPSLGICCVRSSTTFVACRMA